MPQLRSNSDITKRSQKEKNGKILYLNKNIRDQEEANKRHKEMILYRAVQDAKKLNW
ncbi:hypothetical protein [Maridesulfovibrio sp.]|jgi:hypothetical protein|uniref:hypothetical protein n=1 Tax=Maridesulfovibrio sp. TaxID=2795000 RepID=UPI0029CA3230|nr:hypothetical protein [Maridesulfovibrio sp.]